MTQYRCREVGGVDSYNFSATTPGYAAQLYVDWFETLGYRQELWEIEVTEMPGGDVTVHEIKDGA